jgi:asparagine synthase (glutamine-hydrolysing)
LSAITFFINWDGKPVDRSVLTAANECVRHRCPDGAWVWADGAVGMSQADLATLPEDEPGIPVISGHLRIAASCRIDNRDEILRALPRDCRPRSNTDTAVILAAYEAWGEGCVDRLIGDFAFVVWDSKNRRIFAARDLSGVRQLFYYRDRKRLIIASDRTQILQDPTVPFEVDEEQIVEYLTPIYQWTSGWDQGLFRGFSVLQAGSVLRAEQCEVTVRRFWEWGDSEPDYRPEQQVIEEYLHTLEDAVRCRLRSRNGKVAMELSGGLDSPAIACLAARLNYGSEFELHTLSMVFDAIPEVDERRRIHQILEDYSLISHFFVGDKLFTPPCFNASWLPRTVMGPYEIMSSTAVFQMDGIAIQAGCQIVLGGDMGDSLNDGCPDVYFDLLRRGKLREVFRRIQIDLKRSKKRTIRELILHGLLPMAPLSILQAGLIARERRRRSMFELPAYLKGPIRDQIHSADLKIRLRRVAEAQVRCPSVRWTLYDLRPMTPCTMPSTQPLERRYPYSDRRLVEMVLSMPQELKWEHERSTYRTSRRLHHRKAMAGILPNDYDLDAANVGVNFSSAVKYGMRSEAMNNWLRYNSEIQIISRGYVEPVPFFDEIAQATMSMSIHYIEAVLCLEGFLRLVGPGGSIRRLIPPRGNPSYN